MSALFESQSSHLDPPPSQIPGLNLTQFFCPQIQITQSYVGNKLPQLMRPIVFLINWHELSSVIPPSPKFTKVFKHAHPCEIPLNRFLYTCKWHLSLINHLSLFIVNLWSLQTCHTGYKINPPWAIMHICIESLLMKIDFFKVSTLMVKSNSWF